MVPFFSHQRFQIFFSMQNQLQIFKHERFGNIRTVMGDDGEPRFCLADVCKALGLTAKTVTQRLDRGVVSKCSLLTSGGQQFMSFVNEDGLYDTILESRKPEAKAFRKWVTSEVLPSIRKHGAYMTDQALQRAIAEPDFLISLATQIKRERELREIAETKMLQQRSEIVHLEGRIEHQQIEIETKNQEISYLSSTVEHLRSYEEYVNGSPDKEFINQIAQDFGMTAIQFNKMLHQFKIQYKCNGQSLLYAPYRDAGYVTTARIPIGENRFRDCTAWTRRGRMFLYHFLKQQGILPVMERKQ